MSTPSAWDILSSAIKPVTPVSGQKVFKIAVDGTVTLQGYDADEIESLLKAYREHMQEFAEAMNRIQAEGLAQSRSDGGYT